VVISAEATYHRCSESALYLNVFVGVVRAFLKIPVSKKIAPTQKQPPFLVAQLILMALFIAVGLVVVKKFRLAQIQSA